MADVCTECRTPAIDCTLHAYAGNGVYTRTRTAKRATWHGIAQPSGIDFLEDVPCTPASELQTDYSVVPVTHTRAGTAGAGTVWLYYARGCSDVGWGLGRTLLARNREDLALKLMARLRHPASNRGAPAQSVAQLLRQHYRGYAMKVLRAANSSRYAAATRYWATARRHSSIDLAELVADAAEGLVQRGASGGCHMTLETSPRDTETAGLGSPSSADSRLERVCAGSCAVRARALQYVFGAIGDEGKVCA